MTIAIIAVLDQANGIGKDNKLLCHLPADLKRFKQLTNGHSIIMGRKTFESLPKGPLPNRNNIILTRDLNYKAQGCNILHSMEEVINQCKLDEKIFIIGGGEIYTSFFHVADFLHITRISHVFEADTFFPEIDAKKWKEDSYIEMQADDKNRFNFSFIDYSKKN
jgi:dihydrofolate reductase